MNQSALDARGLTQFDPFQIAGYISLEFDLRISQFEQFASFAEGAAGVPVHGQYVPRRSKAMARRKGSSPHTW